MYYDKIDEYIIQERIYAKGEKNITIHKLYLS